MSGELENQQLVAAERASWYFGHLVDGAMSGAVRTVEVSWEDRQDEHGEPDPTPHVTIDGKPANSYVRTRMKYASKDTELIDLTAERFESMVGQLWASTVDAIVELDVALDGLAVSGEAGFFDAAEAQFQEHGIDASDGEVVETARGLAAAAVAEWHEATSPMQFQ